MSIERDFELVDAPAFNAMSFQVSASGTGCIVVISDVRPVISKDGPGAVSVAACSITMSHHALKELAFILQDTVRQVEAAQGEIRTPWLDERPK